ncbi:MAG TPA: hypothetical protein VFV94_20220, partial [Polyangiaceae bacterium]|nr:hypothetical protein [Polyangiaceae bacterium]
MVRLTSLPRTGLALVLLVASAGTARAQGMGMAAPINECEVDADCGHGFACEVAQTGTGGTLGTGGASSGAAADAAPSTGGVAGTAMGMGGAGALAGASTGGTGQGVPLPSYCGDMICQLPAESSVSCPLDCGTGYKYCAPATCEEQLDCADGYRCAEAIGMGTGGASSVPNYCGDGV